MGVRVGPGVFLNEAEVVAVGKLLQRERRRAAESGAVLAEPLRSVLASSEDVIASQTYEAAAKLSQVKPRQSVDRTCDTAGLSMDEELTSQRAADWLHVDRRTFWRLVKRGGVEPVRSSPGRPSWWSRADVAGLVTDRGSV